MSEEFGPDFITVTDEDGNDFELEHLDTLEYNNEVYMAFFPAVSEDAQEGEPADIDLDDEEYGLIIMKVVEEDGEELLSTLDSDEELDLIYNQFMERLFADRTGSPARCVMGSFKPTFLKRDTPSQRGLQASRLPLRHAGSWKQ